MLYNYLQHARQRSTKYRTDDLLTKRDRLQQTDQLKIQT